MHTARTSVRVGLAPLAAAASLVACAATNGAPTAASATTAAIERREARTLAEAKLDSRLLDALDRVVAGGEPAWDRNPLDLDANGRVLIDVTARVTAGLLQHIEANEGIVISQFPQYDSIHGRLPMDRLLALAERADVKFIRPAEQAVTNPGTGTVPR
jgi:hypothetical protein